MSLTWLYYFIKPVLPWHVRIGLRRAVMTRRRKQFADVWPIAQGAAASPAGWPGWPDGKKFALVLTHDVEGAKGLQRVPELMRMEQRLGFRSSFNFVPEGGYSISAALRNRLEHAGFEVGVHGLRHDGKLYTSRKAFNSQAACIRSYLDGWRARGFRSPFMHHRLDWLHRLGVDYDMSTFDTDPFEPQPDSVMTIFPFWVSGGNGTGYVEMPYTLPQDFTLFVLFRERTVDIWKRKLDWLARHGGMVLINTHPDYMCFNGARPGRDEYPVHYYEEFLNYVKQRYAGQYWDALPRDVAAYYRTEVPLAERSSRKKICMVTHSIYERDNRVRRYAEALARRGDHVQVIAVAGPKSKAESETLSGVTVHRVQRREHNERTKWSFAYRLIRFLTVSSLRLTQLHSRSRFDVVHVHNVPDFLVFSAWYPKLTGAKLILDIHDIVPEFFASKFGANKRNRYVRLLEYIEKASAWFVDHVIVSNHLWRSKLLQRSATPDKCSVMLNHVDPGIFYRRPRTRRDDRFVILFPGGLQRHQGLDVAIAAFDVIKDEFPLSEFHIYGDGGMKLELIAMVAQLGLQQRVRFFDSLPIDQIAQVVANADLGIVPKRADSFGNEAYSTKIMEFMSQGVPMVVSRTKIDTFYFNEKQVHFFDSGDPLSMANALREVMLNDRLRQQLVTAGLNYAEEHGWENKRQDYLDLVDSLSSEAERLNHDPMLPFGLNNRTYGSPVVASVER
jgi:glycosyltransferase involved in cell wall biosynthesis/peptidoglycan/xylan/chitin deacetylase (PgdA/CDA1 family)